MAFFEELGRKAKDVAAVAADKAKDMAAVAADKARETTEKTKISVAIAGEQREIEKNCRLIGEWFINEYEGELPEGVQELADAVAASKARIAELEEQKNAIKVEHSEVSAAEPGMKICPVCGGEFSYRHQYGLERKYCSRACANKGRWKEGDANGRTAEHRT